jgi:hypothetical protein
MCPRCREDFDIDTKLWKVGITPGADCELLGTRCAERQHVGVNKQGNPALFIWGEATNQGVPVNPILICGTAAQTQCADFIKRSKILGDVAPSFINQFAQKKKWQVAVKILDHVEGGGHLFAQGFAAETLDLALWQMNGMISFQDCLAFSGMAIADFPKRFPYIRFSNINCTAADVSAALTISNIYDARSQNHIGNPTTEPSNTNAFARTFADTATFLDLSNGDYAKYLKGAAGNGEYCYLAGTANSGIALSVRAATCAVQLTSL